MGSAGSNRDGDPYFTSTPTAKREAQTRELVDRERLVAETHRSGVRAKSPEVDGAPAFDISNAVTKVHRAVELDMFLPPTVEVTVAVSETIPLAPPPSTPATSAVSDVVAPAREADGWAAQRRAFDVPNAPDPVSRPAGGARRIVAALLFVAVMTAACAVLVAAARQGRLPMHPALAPLVERAERLLR